MLGHNHDRVDECDDDIDDDKDNEGDDDRVAERDDDIDDDTTSTDILQLTCTASPNAR